MEPEMDFAIVAIDLLESPECQATEYAEEMLRLSLCRLEDLAERIRVARKEDL